MAGDSPLADLHSQAGATLGDYFSCRLPARFSDVAVEQKIARELVALFDTNYHAFFYFTGPDRVRYLNAITTNNVVDLKDGQGTIGLLLNPQGHILAELECYALPGRLFVISHAMVRERTAQTLDKYIIMDDVTLEDASDQIGSVAIEGPTAAALMDTMCGVKLEAMAELSHREVMLGAIPCRLVRRTHYGRAGAEFVAERGLLGDLWKMLLEAVHAHAGRSIGYDALNALRLEAGIPWYSYDFDDTVIPHEAGLETSHISYTKGCYTGQEIVERVRSRGHVNRRRVGLRFAGQNPPQKGTKLLAEGKEVGYVSSAALSARLATVIGMGYVRGERNSPGSQLEWDEGAAEVIEMPMRG